MEMLAAEVNPLAQRDVEEDSPKVPEQSLRIAMSMIDQIPRRRHSIASSPKQLWTTEEDMLLLGAVKEHGLEAWPRVAESLPGRVSKQCRDRYRNHLCPQVKKGSWTAEEDAILARFQKVYGNQWAEIAKHLPGRTDLSVKNRFYSCARKYDRHLKRLARSPPTARAQQLPMPQTPSATAAFSDAVTATPKSCANKKRKIEPCTKTGLFASLDASTLSAKAGLFSTLDASPTLPKRVKSDFCAASPGSGASAQALFAGSAGSLPPALDAPSAVPTKTGFFTTFDALAAMQARKSPGLGPTASSLTSTSAPMNLPRPVLPLLQLHQWQHLQQHLHQIRQMQNSIVLATSSSLSSGTRAALPSRLGAPCGESAISPQTENDAAMLLQFAQSNVTNDV